MKSALLAPRFAFYGVYLGLKIKRVFTFPITWGIVAALLVVLPQLHHSQFRDDDYIQLSILAGKVTYPWMGPFNLYGFVSGNPDDFPIHINKGPTLWSMDPATKVNFLRPLSSALMALNYKFSGLNPLGYTVHSLLWYLLAIFFFGLILLRMFPRPRSGLYHPAVFPHRLLECIPVDTCFPYLRIGRSGRTHEVA